MGVEISPGPTAFTVMPCSPSSEAALGGAVGRCADAGDVLVHGGDVYDPAAVPHLDHFPRRPLGAEERPGEVRVQYLTPLLVRKLQEISRLVPGSRVVDEYVHAA
jgi:hypothetical protein